MTDPHTCPFCTIAHTYAPSPPSTPTAFPPPSHLLLSTPLVLAFLDIMPITRGHVLVATRAHRPKLSDVTVAEARALGVWVGVVSRAVVRAVGMREGTDAAEDGKEDGEGGEDGEDGEMDGAGVETGERGFEGDWNVVQNNGARAAQVVPHVHFHIIPRPSDVPNIEHKSWTVFGKGQREELDEEDAGVLVRRMREALGREVARVRRREGVDLDGEGEWGVEVGARREGRVGREKL